MTGAIDIEDFFRVECTYNISPEGLKGLYQAGFLVTSEAKN